MAFEGKWVYHVVLGGKILEYEKVPVSFLGNPGMHREAVRYFITKNISGFDVVDLSFAPGESGLYHLGKISVNVFEALDGQYVMSDRLIRKIGDPKYEFSTHCVPVHEFDNITNKDQFFLVSEEGTHDSGRFAVYDASTPDQLAELMIHHLIDPQESQELEFFFLTQGRLISTRN